jgi:hypothetical protein
MTTHQIFFLNLAITIKIQSGEEGRNQKEPNSYARNVVQSDVIQN